MKRLRLPRIRRIPRPSRTLIENLLVAGAFFGGFAIASTAVALIYFPAGLFLAGGSLSALAALYARSSS